MKGREKVTNFSNFLARGNLMAKLVAFLMAVLLWFYVNSKKIGEMEFKIPVSFTNLSRNMIVTDQQKKFITVVFKGNREEITSINKKLVSAEVNLGKPVIGQQYKYSIEIKRSEIPENIAVYSVEKSLFVRIDKKSTKKVKVVPIIEGKLKSGYVMGNIEVNPEEVEITGPEILIKDINKIETIGIQIDDKTETITRSIGFKDIAHESVSINNDQKIVEIKLPIYEASNVSRVDLVINILNLPEDVEAKPELENIQAYVRIINDKSILGELKTIDIDYNKIKSKIKFRRKDKVDFEYVPEIEKLDTENYKILSIVPEVIKIEFSKIEE